MFLDILKMVVISKSVLPYISPYLGSITCGCVQNTATGAAKITLVLLGVH